MHAFHAYLTGLLYEHLKKRHVVTWYDPVGAFEPYIEELVESGDSDAPVVTVGIQDISVPLLRYEGAFFGVRMAAEPLVAVDRPEPLLIYLPGVEHDRTGSVLMELERAGTCYEPQLKRLARNILRESHTDGVIDALLAPEHITYQDIVRFLEQGAENGQASLLKAVFDNLKDNTLILAAWLADDVRDGDIRDKEAVEELYKLIEMRLGLALIEDVPLPDARRKTIQYLLVNEFRSDLEGDPPASIGMVPKPSTKDHGDRIHAVAEALRAEHPDAYVGLADQVENDLSLATASIRAENLGAIDTFRFEERLLLTCCDAYIAKRAYGQAMTIVEGRGRSFWVDREVARQAQWEACRLMAELGLLIETVHSELKTMRPDPAAWVQAYTRSEGWHRVDLTHRTLEAWVGKMDDEPETEKALGVIRRAYEECLKDMAEGFSNALRQSGTAVSGVLRQTHIYPELVASRRGRVAYVIVDAMRYEMGVELTRQFQDCHDLAIRPAVAALPTITPVGMAALLPGAASSFSVVEEKGKPAARIENTVMPGLPARQKFLKARVPDVVDMPIGKLLQTSLAKLERDIGGASLVVVRSQEIDSLGESHEDWLARQVMDTCIGNVARAIRKLARAGIEHFVVTADHGHQFALKKGEDMQTDNPGGDTVGVHRRCWIGRGGMTPPGAVRFTGAELGYDTDLDFIFPTGLAVLSTQGGLSYHHGGISLQELLAPVVTLRFPPVAETQPGIKVLLADVPSVLTNRTFGIKVSVDPDLFTKDPIDLRIILLADGEQVGQAGMAIGGAFDRATGCVAVTPDHEASVGMLLMRDCTSFRIVIQNPRTDAVLAQSDEIPVNLGI